MQTWIARNLGLTATEFPTEGTWIDTKGHERKAMLKKNGDYHTTKHRREIQKKQARMRHVDWLLEHGYIPVGDH